ncbi:MAG TPA: DUF3047 domain-containing protein [Methylomirabilota bacterium]|jgi:hypothetical protein|nr:DUF3047 domain-containing protein [Methylomirabilota bacterium]
MRARLVTVLLLGVVATAAAQTQTVIEDWSSHAVGSKGIPAGWTKQSWGSPQYNFVIAANGTQKVLHMQSANEGSTISRDIKGKVNLKDTPLIEWSWKVVTLPKGGDSCKKATDDQAAQVFVVWPRFPTQVRSRIIGYVWDTSEPAGTICKSEKTGTVTYVVIRSGANDLGKWFTERRNVIDDFRKIYGEEPDNPEALSIAIDSNDTNSTAESMVGTILFRRP